MKARQILSALLPVIVAACMAGSACRRSTDNGPRNGPSPAPSPVASPSGLSGKSELEVITEADTAMILRVEKDVSLKAKGAPEFVRILSGLFRGGDMLQVGDLSQAWVSCPDGSVCPLGKGLYSECCRGACDNGIRIPPPANSESQKRMILISRNELPPGELRMLEIQEEKIRNLGADELTTQFLFADLYSSWKLTEATDKVKDLSLKLKEPESRKELKTLYVPLLRKTGDMQIKVNRNEAEDTYKKAVELAPRFNDSREKAAAHRALAEYYERTGEKEKAVLNLEKSEQIYQRDGETTKAAAARKAIVNIQKQ